MTASQLGLLLVPVWPLILAAGILAGRGRPIAVLAAAPLPALAVAWAPWLFEGFVLGDARLGIGLAVPVAGRMLFGACALLWMLAGWFAADFLREDPRIRQFAAAWLMTLAGSVGLFVAADLATFYMLFALLSLAACGLVIHNGTPEARRATRVYLVLALAGEAFLLLAFVLLAAGPAGDTLALAEISTHAWASPFRSQAFVFLLLGFGIKLGLVPLHGWLPIAHPAAPVPASAVLSGALVKAGALGFLVFLPWGVPQTDWGHTLLVAGLATALLGALLGLVQDQPKTLLAYSSVSQMGLVAATLGAGFAAAIPSTREAASLYAVHHVFVKGSLFLSVGLLATLGGRWRGACLGVSAILALSFAGLPFTGGMIAKLVAKPCFAPTWTGPVLVVSSILSAALMIRFVVALAAQPGGPAATPRLHRILPWALCAIGGLIVPWVLVVTIAPELVGKALSIEEIGTAVWPVAFGGVCGWLWARHGRWKLPAGDIVCLIEALRCGHVLRRADRLDASLAEWKAAALALAVAALFFLLAGLLG